MEARAINRYINSSPRKMRLVIDLIRGKSVPDALAILHFSPKHAAKAAEKTVRSAVSNLQNKDEAGRIETESLYISEAFVNEGPSLKRMLPAPMGRAYRMVKRSNHLTVVITQRQQKVKQAPKPKAAKPTSKKTEQEQE
ncbi:MAG: 50S ribosomal protein L22 [Ignavibacteriae bacterium]|nr:50S ribosomal protein L22 [Ignavibacteria bacterium]MBI3364481.1 50S ribosomal protein L22 [Ignavibacteriota bacterium]